MAASLRIGIRELVEFSCRSGDLGGDGGSGVKALQGLHTHQKIQQRYAAEATAEYAIKRVINIDGEDIELGGRIDLLFAGESPPRIEEIKTVSKHSAARQQDALHWAQLKCYAACYASEQGLAEVMLSLNLVNLFGGKEQRHKQPWRSADLEAFLEESLRVYLRWHRMVEQQRRQTREQAQALSFPFEQFRGQQHRFAAEVYRAIREQQRLMVEAPTGSGKTISTLFPAVKALGENLCDQIVYLSAKVSGQQQAQQAVELMTDAGLDIACLVIQAKARSCPCNFDEDEIDDEGNCQRCIGFFDRLPAAREQLFKTRRFGVEQVQAVASEFQICPFELGLQMLPWAEVIICDFNYVFDPQVQLSYFRNDSSRKVLLVDELHNLVDRARGMYSASLSRRQLRKANDADNSRQMAKALKAMQLALDTSIRSLDSDETIDDEVPDALLQASYRFSEKLGFDLFTNKHIAPETQDVAKAVIRFQCIAQLFGPHHKSIAQKPLNTRELKLLCLNAFEYLHDCYPMFQAVCGFSATLSPPDYFLQALGLGNEANQLKLASAFPVENLKVCIASYIDTRYRERDAHIDNICHAIARCYRVRSGNYLVFFSSYYFMQAVYQRFAELYADISALMQQRDFDEAAQQAFLTQFSDDSQQLGFAIMGGRFAEGIDYRGDRLIGAIVVGVGLPQANSEQQLIQNDFDAMQLDGFDYAFRYPGLIRVKQSAGRVIRSEKDKGVVILLERRFQQAGYRQQLPQHWQPQFCNNVETLEQALKEFWEHQDGTD